MGSRFLLLILSLGTFLQAAMAQEETDTIAVVVRPITPSLYLDYGKLLTYPLSFESKIEVGAELLFKEKIPLIFEFGTSTLNPTKVYANGSYQAKGSYLRVGTGIYNQWTPKNKIGLTVRYATSTFDEVATLSTGDPINVETTLSDSFDRTGINANWLELVLYSDAKMFTGAKFEDTFLADLFVVGMNLRFRYLLNYDLQAPDDVYAIPGYGHSFDDHLPAANLFLKVSF